MEKKFVQVQNHVIHIDSIGYVDFLESGRAMIFIPGLAQEKQNISVDPADAARLKKALNLLQRRVNSEWLTMDVLFQDISGA